MNYSEMTQKQIDRLIIVIFGEPQNNTVDNGSDGVDDDPFMRYESAQDAIEHA